MASGYALKACFLFEISSLWNGFPIMASIIDAKDVVQDLSMNVMIHIHWDYDISYITNNAEYIWESKNTSVFYVVEQSIWILINCSLL